MSTGRRSQIATLREAGLSAAEIARRLELAPPTVDYRLAKLNSRPPIEFPRGREPFRAARQNVTRSAVAALLSEGHSRARIARELGLSKATVSYHARRLGQTVDARCARRYDWSAVQHYYDDGHSVRECMETFGFASGTWFEAVRRGAVKARPPHTPIEELLQPGTFRGRNNLKSRLLNAGLKEARCERCGLADWCGLPLTLALHHRNGRRDDNRLENLQLLCPNCHSQTDTFAGRNGRRTASKGGRAGT